MRTKKDTQRSLDMVSGYGHASPTAWAGLVAVLHDLVDRLPDDEQPMDVFQLKAQQVRTPAPLMVDEAEIRGLIVRVDEEGGWSNIFPEEAVALAAAIAAHLGGARR